MIVPHTSSFKLTPYTQFTGSPAISPDLTTRSLVKEAEGFRDLGTSLGYVRPLIPKFKEGQPHLTELAHFHTDKLKRR